MELDHYLKELTKELTQNKEININPEKVDYFNSLIDELYEAAQKYSDYSLMHNEMSTLISDTRYASGSKALHRGFYCPSPILEFVAGGYKRGKLINKPTKASNEYYQYLLDNHQQLICINQYLKSSSTTPYATEFIIRQDNIEYGITFHNASKSIQLLARCEYEDNKLKSYATASYSPGIPKDIISIQYEEYQYIDDLLCTVDFYPGIIPSLNLYEHTQYDLIYDNDKLVEYIAKSVYQGQLMERRHKV